MVVENKSFKFEQIDINKKEHQQALLSLMNDYMMDEMGLSSPLPVKLGEEIVRGLKTQNNYLGFLLKYEEYYIALANCFVAFSTFRARQLINIHDFIVSPNYRKLGVGEKLLNKIAEFGKTNDYSKITLEVRHDNPKAQNLYKKTGFTECSPPMYFWQKCL